MSKKIKLVTPVPCPIFLNKIKSNSKILTLGSCFSDNIGTNLREHSFETLINPFGTVFNPISISKLVHYSLNGEPVDIEEIHSIMNRFFHYDFHSSFDNTEPEKVVKKINSALKTTLSFIKSMDVLFLTFGTSIVYKLIENQQIVSNCHKVPSVNFSKIILTSDYMEEECIKLVKSIRTINPSVKIILTVSPVRHTKEGMVENNLSKSRLIDLCYRLCQAEADISYFPAYEIMMDELRDYRYYRSDLIHPNELAIDIIWERVLQSYFDEKSNQKVKDMAELNLAVNHTPFDPISEEHLKFKHKQVKKIESLISKYPEVDFLKYIQFFNKEEGVN